MRLTSYQKFLVERYITHYYDLSIKDYCEKYCTTKINIDHFTQWFSYFKIKNKKFPSLVKKFRKTVSNEEALSKEKTKPKKLIVNKKPQPPREAASNFVLSEKAKELIDKYTYFFNMYYHCFRDEGHNSGSEYSLEAIEDLVKEYTYKAAYEGIWYFKNNPIIIPPKDKKRTVNKAKAENILEPPNTFSAFEINQHSMGVVLVNGDKSNE